MIVVMKPEAREEEVRQVVDELKSHELQVQINHGTHCTVLGVLGDTTVIDKERFSLLDGVDRVVPVQDVYKRQSQGRGM